MVQSIHGWISLPALQIVRFFIIACCHVFLFRYPRKINLYFSAVAKLSTYIPQFRRKWKLRHNWMLSTFTKCLKFSLIVVYNLIILSLAEADRCWLTISPSSINDCLQPILHFHSGLPSNVDRLPLH